MIPLRYFGNKVLQYVFLKYASFGIQFLATLLIAYKLGPKEFGNWSYVLIILQVFNSLNFGIPNAISNQLSINKHHEKFSEFVFKNGISLLIVNLSIISLFFFLFIHSEYFSLHSSNIGYSIFFIYFTIILFNINIFYLGILRVYGDYKLINFYQLILPVSLLVVIVFVSQTNSINWLLGGQMLGYLITTCLFLWNTPLQLGFRFSFRYVIPSLVQGLKLFLHNISHFFIPLATRFAVSTFFSLEVFGLFSFAFSMSSVVVLIMGSFSFLIHPKLLNRLSKLTPGSSQLLDSLREDYATLTNMLLHLATLFYMICIQFFVEYQDTVKLFSILCMAQALFSMEFGFSSLLMAKNRNGNLAVGTFLILSLHVILLVAAGQFTSNLMIISLSLSLSYVLLTTTYFVMCKKYILTDEQNALQYLFKDVFKIKLIIPILLTLVIDLTDFSTLFYGIPVITFFLLNRQELLNLKSRTQLILNNSSVVDL